MSGRILVVDDEVSVCELLAAHLSKHGFEVAWRATGEEGFELAMSEDFDVVITDVHMRGLNGLDLAERLTQNRPDLPVVVITAFGSLDTAVAAIRVGAYDFVTKPFELEQIRITASRAIQHKQLRDEVKRLRRLQREPRTAGIDPVSDSPRMRQVYDVVERVADSTASILITGESGTGKEIVARAIHDASPRRDGPFVVVNCAALPDALLESELFGHTRGAFTDARAERQGLFAAARGGTLLLDEIAEIPLSLQPKLLRVVQSRRVRPLGSDVEVPVDVRILSATHRDLETRVEEGSFREDLFYRICVIHIDVPPLRSRGGDILRLAQHFLGEHARAAGRRMTGISPAAADKLLAYEWPGNVRELQNCIERAVALARFDQITVEDLPEKLRAYRPNHVLVAGHDPEELVTMEEVERRYVTRVLEAVKGNKSLAARVLGFDRATLYRKLERYGLSAVAPGKSSGD